MKELTCSNNINSSLTGDIGNKPNTPLNLILTGDICNKPNTLELLYYNDSKSCLVSRGFTAVVNTNEGKK